MYKKLQAYNISMNFIDSQNDTLKQETAEDVWKWGSNSFPPSFFRLLATKRPHRATCAWRKGAYQ